MKPRLPLPIRKVLSDDANDVAIERSWRAIKTRRSPGRGRQRMVFALAACAACLLLVFAFGRWRARAPSVEALRLESNAPLVAGFSFSGVAALSDGSRVSVDEHGALDLVESTPSKFALSLRRGRATFDVRPGGPRAWSIDAGLARVDVIGTRFTVENRGARVEVLVERGKVQVTSDKLAGRMVTLVAGEHVLIDANDSPTPGTTGGAVPNEFDASVYHALASDDAGASGSTNDAATAAAPIESAKPWKDLAGKGAHREAYETLGASGITRETRSASVDELFALADVARLSGHPADAVAPLSRIVAEFSSDSRAALAAFTLGRIQLDSLGRGPDAVRSFSRAKALGLPSGLEEDCYARLAEAHARSGDRGSAARVGEEYLARYPNGRHVSALARYRIDAGGAALVDGGAHGERDN